MTPAWVPNRRLHIIVRPAGRDTSQFQGLMILRNAGVAAIGATPGTATRQHFMQSEACSRWSPCRGSTHRRIGDLYDPLDGHLDPSGTTHAYAKAARMQGAEIVLRNPVLDLRQLPGLFDPGN